MPEPSTYFVEARHDGLGWLRLKVEALELEQAAGTLELLLLQYSPHVDQWRLVNSKSGAVAMLVDVGVDCGLCGGSGGGDEPHLKCPRCLGAGVLGASDVG